MQVNHLMPELLTLFRMGGCITVTPLSPIKYYSRLLKIKFISADQHLLLIVFIQSLSQMFTKVTPGFHPILFTRWMTTKCIEETQLFLPTVF